MNYDKEYFKNRGVEKKHYIQVIQWLNTLQKKMVINDETKAYDYGCGRGPYIHTLNYFGINTSGYDISNNAINNPIGLANDKTSTILSKDEYSIVICIDVLEHVQRKEEEEVCKNIVRLVKQGGYLIMSICDITLKDVYKDSTHINLKSREYWEYKFKSLGFELLPIIDWVFKNQMYLLKKL